MPCAVLLDEAWFEMAKFVVPASDEKRITIRLDEDIVEHFKQDGPGSQSRINDVLRTYVTSKRREGEGQPRWSIGSRSSLERRGCLFLPFELDPHAFHI